MEKENFVENLLVLMNGCKLRLETATRSDILYLFGQGNDFLLGKNQGI